MITDPDRHRPGTVGDISCKRHLLSATVQRASFDSLVARPHPGRSTFAANPSNMRPSIPIGKRIDDGAYWKATMDTALDIGRGHSRSDPRVARLVLAEIAGANWVALAKVWAEAADGKTVCSDRWRTSHQPSKSSTSAGLRLQRPCSSGPLRRESLGEIGDD